VNFNHRSGLALDNEIFGIGFGMENPLLNGRAGLEIASLQIEVVDLVKTLLDIG
jgi:hypothetical protein